MLLVASLSLFGVHCCLTLIIFSFYLFFACVSSSEPILPRVYACNKNSCRLISHSAYFCLPLEYTRSPSVHSICRHRLPLACTVLALVQPLRISLLSHVQTTLPP